MPPKHGSVPKLRQGERVILKGQGGYRRSASIGWKVVHIFLTDQRLILYQASSVMLEVPLDDITGLRKGRFYYVMKDRDALCVSYGTEKGKAEFWLIANKIENWREKIHRLALLSIDEKTIERIAAQVDSDGRGILWYLWEKGHARITDLAELIDAPNHMHVLLIIKETINPVGERVVGCPILSFERSKVDPETGKSVLFSWWLVGQREKCVPNEERIIDIFDEDSHIQVIMEVKGIEASDVRLDISGNQLRVRSHKIGGSLREGFSLPAEVTLDNYHISLKNNLLEIRLTKVQCLKSNVQRLVTSV